MHKNKIAFSLMSLYVSLLENILRIFKHILWVSIIYVHPGLPSTHMPVLVNQDDKLYLY